MAEGLSDQMPHYIAIVEDAGQDRAIGVWFPDLPGCFSGGDTMDEALLNAPEALMLYADSLAEENKPLPAPRNLSSLRADPNVADDFRDHIVALVTLPSRVAAAE